MQVCKLAKKSTGTPKVDVSSIGSLVGRSVAFVLLSAVDADEDDSVPAGLHSGRYSKHAARDRISDIVVPYGNQIHN